MALATPPPASLPSLDTLRIAQVGYGEVGRIFAAALAPRVREIVAFDTQHPDAAWRSDAEARARADRVLLAARLADATREADVVFSAVTAAQALAAIRDVARCVRPGALVVDFNSASPRTKKACAEAIHAAGARYVEAAVMSAVPPHGIRVPTLLGGPHAAHAHALLARLGFDAPVGASDFGTVSAIKLCRSVVIKGMEALAVESLAAARFHGVEEPVLASLAETFPGMDWPKQAGYFWKRVYQHGKRRAEEMREAAVAVEDAGLAPRMASATADLQAWFAAQRASGAFEGLDAASPWRELADRLARSKG